MEKRILDEFKVGIKDAVPIALAYLSVSFAFGLSAKEGGLSIFSAVLISATNLTSAGQFAGLDIIKHGGSLLELILTTIIINLRYCLMSFALSQRVDKKVSTLQRMIVSFGITDEVFAVISQKDKRVGFKYFLGLILTPIIAWTLGTFLGSGASTLLPLSIRSALSVAIYGMFIGIIIPPAKKCNKYFIAVIISVLISTAFKYVPILNIVSGGWVIIIAALVSAGVCAYLFPISEDELQ